MANGFADLATEAQDPRYAQVDRLPIAQVAALMNDADATVPSVVGQAIPVISAAVEAIVDRLRSGGRLIYVGAGTSGRLAVLDAAECPPTFGTDPSLVVGIIAGGYDALVRSVEGAEDDDVAGTAAIAAEGVGPGDAVVGISASGAAPFVIGAMDEATRLGALTVGVCCTAGAALSAHVAHPLELVVGAEVVAGSTRLKAGTATKLVLNMISTITMIKLGRTYGNRMIEVSASNAKLADRATHIVMDVTGADEVRARAALTAADRQVKVAIVMIEKGLGVEAARAVLAANDGHLDATRDVPLTPSE